jgi:hypothetical protein
MNAPDATWRLETPATGTGAIAVIAVVGDVDGALAALGVRPVAVGEVRLRSIAGIDDGIAARWANDTIHLMPHGGPAVAGAIAERLAHAGIRRDDGLDPRAAYPEATDDVEALMLHALARAASPLAIDLLLDQPRRWRDAGQSSNAPSERGAPGSERDATLRRLIHPSLVVAIGATNIGKSTLCNALAGSAVSIVADEPGTTRDHVGVSLDLAGLVVRYVDTPGLGAPSGAIEREAERLAASVASQADLILRCGDARHPPPDAWPACASLTIALRADLGGPAWRADAATAAARGEGVGELARLIRDTLVPPGLLADPAPWRFWEDPPVR